MKRIFDYVNGLYSLGSGSPFYRHSFEERVPWPHIEHPLRNATGEERNKWIAAGGDPVEIDREIERLGRIQPPSEITSSSLVSNNLYKPSKVTYTTLLPYTTGIGKTENLGGGRYRWRVVDPDFTRERGDEGALTPGHCILREFRVMVPENVTIEKISLSAGRLVKRHLQTFHYPETGIIDLLQRHLGMPLVTSVGSGVRCLSIPFFFSRDPMYGLPVFVVGEVEISIQFLNDSGGINLISSLEVLHSKEEVRQVRNSRLHRVEDLSCKWSITEYIGMEKWIYANCFWREISPELSGTGGRLKARLLHEGTVDEEIKGVFWKLGKAVDDGVEVGLEYTFEGERSVSLVDILPSAILSELDLRTRILPTTSGAFLTPPALRKDLGGFLCSKYVDSVDCEPGLSPRNGELFLNLHGVYKEEVVGIYLLTSRDITVT